MECVCVMEYAGYINVYDCCLQCGRPYTPHGDNTSGICDSCLEDNNLKFLMACEELKGSFCGFVKYHSKDIKSNDRQLVFNKKGDVVKRFKGYGKGVYMNSYF